MPVPTSVSAAAVAASTTTAAPATASRTIVRLMIPANPRLLEGCAPRAAASVVVPRLARHHHTRAVSPDHHARLHRPDIARASAREPRVARAELGKLLQVLDGGEHEPQPVPLEL